MRKTKRLAILGAVVAIASSIVVSAAGASTERVRENDRDGTTTTTTTTDAMDRDRLRQCDRDRAPDRPVDCRVDPPRRLQCDRDREIDRPIDCRTDGLRPIIARCVHWALEHTTVRPAGDGPSWVRVCRRIAWNLHHPL